MLLNYANPCKCYDESFCSHSTSTSKLNNASAALTIKYYIYISHGIKDKEMTQYEIKWKILHTHTQQVSPELYDKTRTTLSSWIIKLYIAPQQETKNKKKTMEHFTYYILHIFFHKFMLKYNRKKYDEKCILCLVEFMSLTTRIVIIIFILLLLIVRNIK